MRASKSIPPQGRQVFAFVVDGECELWYIQMLKRTEKSINITLSPEIPQKKKLAEQYNKVIELSKHYDKVFWIIDFDVIGKETHESPKKKKTILQEFKDCYEQIHKNEECKNITIIVNNPCLEYWYLLHFKETSKYFESYDKLKEKELMNCFIDYKKTKEYYTKQKNDIYLRLKPYLSAAIINANKLPAFDFNNTQTGISQMQLMFETDGIKEILKSNF
jgi:hypothetical protein